MQLDPAQRPPRSINLATLDFLVMNGTVGGGRSLEAAVERTEEIEQQLNETAEALDRSNELLREMGANRHSSAPTER